MCRETRLVRSFWPAAAVLACAAVVAGCADTGGTSAPSPDSRPRTSEPLISAVRPAAVASKNPLADTEWRLVEFQSMDDAVGTTRPDEPTRYTMKLSGDGSVALRLNCNSATGSWSSEPAADPSSGRFAFGPLAATSALCPPPSLDELISAQAQYVRSYLLKDGRLYLSLMADGGILAWEPHSDVAFRTTPDPAVEDAIRRASPSYTRAGVDVEGGVGRGRYVYSRVDLNGDGRDEVLAYLLGSIFCGTGGCNLLLFTDDQTGYTLVGKFPISRVPVIVSPATGSGWNDLWRLESGGGAPATYVRHCFDGSRYVECERVPADRVPAGRRVLAGEVAFDRGIPLEPRD
jgi:heat shock protein HslJ